MIQIDLRYFLVFAGGGILNLVLVCFLLSHDYSPIRALMVGGMTVAFAATVIEGSR